eukprot:74500-Pyramimonas_sp.AAC.1
MPRLLHFPSLDRIETALTNHPVRTPLWCRDNATPAALSEPGPYGGRAHRPLENVPRLLHFPTLDRLETAFRDLPLRTPLWCRGNATPATLSAPG